MVAFDDKDRIVNPPWSSIRDFGGCYDSAGENGRIATLLEAVKVHGIGTGVSRQRRDRPNPIAALLEAEKAHGVGSGVSRQRRDRPLPRRGMRVRTCEGSGKAKDHYLLEYTNDWDNGGLYNGRRICVLGVNELKLVPAEHDGDIPDTQTVFQFMYPQFRCLINSPLQTWVALHDPEAPCHVRSDEVTFADEDNFGFTPECVDGISVIRLNRSNLLSPLLCRERKAKGKAWKSLDFHWMLERWEEPHMKWPLNFPLSLQEWLLYGEDGDVLHQHDGCSGIVTGGLMPATNPFIRLATLEPKIKHVDILHNCVSRSMLLLGFVEDADVAAVANWPPRLSLTPLDGSEGTLLGSLKAFNKRNKTYYIGMNQKINLRDDATYSERVRKLQESRMDGVAKVEVADKECESGVRTNHVMAVVKGNLVDPSDGSHHPWPDRDSVQDDKYWLRGVTLVVPFTKQHRAVKEKRMRSGKRTRPCLPVAIGGASQDHGATHRNPASRTVHRAVPPNRSYGNKSVHTKRQKQDGTTTTTTTTIRTTTTTTTTTNAT